MTPPDFAKIAADLAGDTGLEHVIRAALHEAWNAALASAELWTLEQRCERETSWDRACVAIAAGVRAKKLPTGAENG